MNEANFDPLLAKVFLSKFSSQDQLKHWVHSFFKLDMPDSYVDPDSNSSPINWMWEVYETYKNNTANITPSVITVSSRVSYKTLTEAMLATILMIHFGATICHMAAIVPQATAAQKYIANFTRLITPYLLHHNRELKSENAKEISIKNEDGSLTWMKIIVCTITGANSSHSNVLCVDEVDTIRSQEGIRAYKEASFIPGVFNGQHPITIKTSTMKFPGGLFSKEMDLARKEGWPVFKWNIIDITEKCQPERHKPDLPKEIVYVAKSLPLQTISPETYSNLADKEKDAFERQEAMGGCAKCPLFPVCKGRLADRKETDKGGLWKPIDFTIAQFKKTDADLAEAQLMCWKPSSQGMVYPRFLEKDDGSGNVYTVHQAYEKWTGEVAPKNYSLNNLVDLMLAKGIKFYVGGDWGHTHATAFIVNAVMPNGEWWLVDSYSIPGLEWDDILDLAKKIRDRYRPVKWFMDTAEPMFIKTFKKNRMPCAQFTKDITGGIGSVRTQIVDASNTRRLKVIKSDKNEVLLKMFREHCFLLDSIGNVTDKPDDSEIADIGDSLRYAGQNLFKPKK